MSKIIMIGNHISNSNRTHTQYRQTQQNTDDIDDSLESILRKNIYLQQTHYRTQRHLIVRKRWKKNPK